MIYSIHGTISFLAQDTLGIMQGGITWEAHISRNSYVHFQEFLTAHSSETPITVYTWVHSSDKGFLLYGFRSIAEKSMFLTLLRVEGIGPKGALKILSNTTPESLMGFIRSQNTDSLSAISGIGNKKASKILLALENVYVPSKKVSADTVSMSYNKSRMSLEALPKVYKDVVYGLVKMGYDQDAVTDILTTTMKDTDDVQDIDEGIFLHDLIMKLEKT